MKKIIMFFLCSLFSLSVAANDVQKVICSNFEKIDLNSKNAFMEKMLLMDDYVVFKNNGQAGLPTLWKTKNINVYDVKFLNLPEEVSTKIKENVEKDDINMIKSSFARIYPFLKNCQSEKIRNKISEMQKNFADEEKSIFIKETGTTLSQRPLEFFTLSGQTIKDTDKPQKDKTYRYVKEEKMVAGAIHLRVAQVVPDGVLVYADAPQDYLAVFGVQSDKTIFIKTQKEYVDNDFLSSGFYKYVGQKTYSNVIGSNSMINSFEDISDEVPEIHFYLGDS